jgi:hypothetical protein
VEDYANTIIRILNGHTDFREQRAQAFAKENLDWNVLFRKGLEEILDRKLLKKLHDLESFKNRSTDSTTRSTDKSFKQAKSSPAGQVKS